MAPNERDERTEPRTGRRRETGACPLIVVRPPTGTVCVVLAPVGVVDDALAGHLCDVVRLLLEREAIDVVTCDAARAGVDIGLVGALARMHVTARQLGRGIRIRGGTDLRLLVDLVGLTDVLPVEPSDRESDDERR